MTRQVILMLDVQILQFHVNIFDWFQQILVFKKFAVFKRQRLVFFSLCEIKELDLLSDGFVKTLSWESISVCTQIKVLWSIEFTGFELKKGLIFGEFLVQNRDFAKGSAILFGNVTGIIILNDFILTIGISDPTFISSINGGGAIHSTSGVGSVLVSWRWPIGLLRLSNLIDKFALLLHQLLELIL